MKKLCVFLVSLIALAIAFSGNDLSAGRAYCFRTLDIDLSTAGSDTTEVSEFRGSGEIVILLHVTGYNYTTTAGQLYFYTEVQDSLYPLYIFSEATSSNYLTLSDGYQRGNLALYKNMEYSALKVFGEKLHVAYIANGSDSGHVTLDICIRNDD